MAANILANRRRIAPAGLAGGGDGAPGRNWVERADGRIETLAATGSARLEVGDAFVIETPGGGGYGDPHKRDRKVLAGEVRNGVISADKARELYGWEG